MSKFDNLAVLNTAQVAEYLGVSMPTIYMYIKKAQSLIFASVVTDNIALKNRLSTPYLNKTTKGEINRPFINS